MEPTFSSSVKVTPTHSPPASAVHSAAPFIKPVQLVPAASEFTGTGFSAEKHQPTSQTENNRPTTVSMLPGTGFSATKHQPVLRKKQRKRKRPRLSKVRSSLQPSSTELPGTGSSAVKHQPTSKEQSIQPTSTKPNTGSSAVKRSTSKHRPQSSRPSSTDRPLPSDDKDTGSPALHRARRESSVSSISEAGSDLSDRPPLDLYTEEGELSDDQDVTGLDQDQPLSQEQIYRETMRGIRSFMGWSHVPDIDNSANTSEDNPFAGPKTPVPGKVSVQMPTEDWLCKKLEKLNTTLVEGYPSRGSEAGGLSKDVFLRPAKSQSKWYGLFSDHKVDPSAVSSWCTDAAKLNSTYSRIAKHSGLSSTPPASRRISQETLRRWERSAREATVICNQAASFNRCLFKVQQNMQDQLKTLRSEGKGKTSHKSSSAADELQYLMDFNASITQVAAKTMEHLTDFVFISMGNITLARRDAYLSHLRTGIKPDTLNALRTGPLHINTLFPDSALRKAEEDMVSFESKGHSSAGHSKGRYHPYERSDKSADSRSEAKPDRPAWKNINR